MPAHLALRCEQMIAEKCPPGEFFAATGWQPWLLSLLLCEYAMANTPVSKKKKRRKTSTDLATEQETTVTVTELVRDERTHKIAGFSLLLLSVLLLLALGSYCFTWRQDQDKVFSAGAQFLFAENLKVDNLLGRLGAWTGHQLIYNGVGLAAFLLCTLPFVAGCNLIFGKPIFSIWRNVKYTATGLLFFSVALAFTLPDTGFSFGGGMGEMVATYLQNLLGATGTALLLLVAGLSWFIWRFNPRFQLPQHRQAPATTPNELPAETAAAAAEAPADDEPAPNPAEAAPVFVPVAGKTINDVYAERRQQQLVTDDPNPLEHQTVQGSGNSLADDAHAAFVPPAAALSPAENDSINMLALVEAPEKTAVPLPVPPKPLVAAVPPAADDLTEPDPEPLPKRITPVAVREIPAGELPGSDLELQINNPVAADDEADEDLPEASIPELAQEQLEPYDPSLELKGYKFPTLDLLDAHGSEKVVADPEELEQHKNQIIDTLKNYDISIQRISATVGPTVTLYEIVPAPGVRISRIKNLEDDIALSLAALGIRIIAPIPGKGTIGIEVPNIRRSVVSMKNMLSNDKFVNSKYSLPVAIGKTIANEPFVVDLAGMPHLLMAGATGQGKSVGINTLLVSLLYKKHPSQLKLVLVDPKKVELSLYRMIEKHFLAKLPGEEEAIITDTKKVINTLNALCIEMDNRYDLLKEAHVRNIKEYNEKFIKRRLNPQKGHQYLPFIVLVIDEFADLIMTAGKEVEMPIARLAQLARAVGIHLIIATQRPSVNIITGTIKANFPSRIAFKVSSKIDSRTILDAGGAEQLIGKGDMLISHNGELIRLQCAFVDTPEVERICEFIGTQRGYPEAFLLPEYVDEKEQEGRDFDLSDRDSLFEEAARLVVASQLGSTSLIQRRMKLGYNRAGRLMDQLEAAGIVGPNQGSKAREVLIKTEAELEQLLSNW